MEFLSCRYRPPPRPSGPRLADARPGPWPSRGSSGSWPSSWPSPCTCGGRSPSRRSTRSSSRSARSSRPSRSGIPTPAEAAAARLPKDGWATSRVEIVAPGGPVRLRQADEPGNGPEMSLLGREIVRQSLLIAARDGLGLGTRDAVGRRPRRAGDECRRRRGRLDVLGRASRGDDQVRRRPADGPWSRSTKPQSPVDHLWLLDQVEPLSRGKFVAALKQAGAAGTPKAARPETPEDPGDRGEPGFPVRGRAILRRPARSMMRSAAVGSRRSSSASSSRGYGMLAGPLRAVPEPLARGLHGPVACSTPAAWRRSTRSRRAAPWHRAFAQAFAGYPKAALDDLAEGDRRAPAAGLARPDWAPLIATFCRNEGEGISVPGIDRRRGAGLPPGVPGGRELVGGLPADRDGPDRARDGPGLHADRRRRQRARGGERQPLVDPGRPRRLAPGVRGPAPVGPGAAPPPRSGRSTARTSRGWRGP